MMEREATSEGLSRSDSCDLEEHAGDLEHDKLEVNAYIDSISKVCCC